jgi:HK97 family phage prohead protease
MSKGMFQKRLDNPIKFTADFPIHKTQETPAGDGEVDLKWIVEGYAIVSGNVDEQMDRIDSSALTKAVEYLKSYTTVLFNHNPDRPIGKIVGCDIREGKIWVRVQISKTEDTLWKQILEGVINSFSISGEIDDFALEFDNTLKQQIRVIKSFRVYEISLVSVPANPEAKTLNAYISKSLNDAGLGIPVRKGEVDLSDLVDIVNIIMEVSKVMGFKEKINQAIKSLGDLAARVSDDQIKSALASIQKLLTEAVAEVPADNSSTSDNYPAVKAQELENAVSMLKSKVETLEQSVSAISVEFEKKFSEVDSAMGSIGEVLKDLLGDATSQGDSTGHVGGE